MTTDVHDHSRPAAAVASTSERRTQPPWLVPALLGVIVGVGLVVAGVISLSTAVSAGLIGGMLLMHLGGHGGHGTHGGATSASEASVDETDKPARPGGCH